MVRDTLAHMLPCLLLCQDLESRWRRSACAMSPAHLQQACHQPPPYHRERLQEARKALPVYSARQRLVEVVKANPCLVLVGETGSGKTTQVPRLLLEAGLAAGGAIACTQPRRIAAITVAQRVAEEMGCALGSQVGVGKGGPCWGVGVSMPAGTLPGVGGWPPNLFRRSGGGHG